MHEHHKVSIMSSNGRKSFSRIFSLHSSSSRKVLLPDKGAIGPEELSWSASNSVIRKPGLPDCCISEIKGSRLTRLDESPWPSNKVETPSKAVLREAPPPKAGKDRCNW